MPASGKSTQESDQAESQQIENREDSECAISAAGREGGRTGPDRAAGVHLVHVRAPQHTPSSALSGQVCRALARVCTCNAKHSVLLAEDCGMLVTCKTLLIVVATDSLEADGGTPFAMYPLARMLFNDLTAW